MSLLNSSQHSLNQSLASDALDICDHESLRQCSQLKLRFNVLALDKKSSFPLRISSINVTKFTGNRGFDHIYWRNPQWKTSFFVQYLLVIHSIISIITPSKSLHLEQGWQTNKYCCVVAQSILDNIKRYIDMDCVIQ